MGHFQHNENSAALIFNLCGSRTSLRSKNKRKKKRCRKIPYKSVQRPQGPHRWMFAEGSWCHGQMEVKWCVTRKPESHSTEISEHATSPETLCHLPPTPRRRTALLYVRGGEGDLSKYFLTLMKMKKNKQCFTFMKRFKEEKLQFIHLWFFFLRPSWWKWVCVPWVWVQTWVTVQKS